MTEDQRCCGTGTCIINSDGVCWCGQVWDGEKMCRPVLTTESDPAKNEKTHDPANDYLASNHPPAL